MKKESLAKILLKGAIIGGGTLIGLAVSKFFTVESEPEAGADGEPEIIDVPAEDIEEVPEGE